MKIGWTRAIWSSLKHGLVFDFVFLDVFHNRWWREKLAFGVKNLKILTTPNSVETFKWFCIYLNFKRMYLAEFYFHWVAVCCISCLRHFLSEFIKQILFLISLNLRAGFSRGVTYFVSLTWYLSNVVTTFLRCGNGWRSDQKFSSHHYHFKHDKYYLKISPAK